MDKITVTIDCPDGAVVTLTVDSDGDFTSPDNDLDSRAFNGLLSFADNKDTVAELKNKICQAVNKKIAEKLEEQGALEWIGKGANDPEGKWIKNED